MLINYYGLKRDVSSSLPNFVCVCLCICMHVCIYIYIYICIYIYIYTYIYIYIYIHIHTHTHIYIHTHTAQNIGTLAILSDNCSNGKCFGIHVLIIFVCTVTTQKIQRRKVKLDKLSHRTKKWPGQNDWHLNIIIKRIIAFQACDAPVISI